MTALGDAVRDHARGFESDQAFLGEIPKARSARRVIDLYALAEEVDQAIEEQANRILELLAEREEEAA